MLTLHQEECNKILHSALRRTDVEYLGHQLTTNVPDGFNGLYFTLKIKYQDRRNGEENELCCFLKSVPRNERHLWFINGCKMLVKEYEMYETVLPTFESCINYQLPVPRCHFLRYVPENQLENVLVLEDLRLQGFVMRSPRLTMTLQECRLVLGALARLHAASIITEARGHSLSQLCKYPDEVLWASDPSHPSYAWAKSSIDTLIEVSEHVDSLKSRLQSREAREKFTKVWEDVVKLINSDFEGHLKVITHGDIWSNNIMFKFEDNIAIDVKIIDMQVYRIVPPMAEVLMFIYLNTTRKQRDLHKTALITEYAQELRNLVEGAGCHPLPPGLSPQALEAQEQALMEFALVAAAGYIPMNKLPPEARVKRQREEEQEGQAEGARDFDVLYDFLNSRSAQVWKGMEMDPNFHHSIVECCTELLDFIGL